MKAIFLSVLLFCLFIFPCAAEEVKSPQMDMCLEKANGVTPDMIDCLQAEYERQDKRLNAAYKKAGVEITAQQKKQLVSSQRAWITFRDTYSSFLYDPDGGQIAHINSMSWLVKATDIRATELEEAVQ
jgi:uncharacterized protein YecT (DUF1311 family)